MSYLDGNALAGPADDLFAFEATTAQARCEACGDVARLAEALVYGRPMGYVARCRNCASVLIVIVEHEQQRSLNMGGLTWLRSPRHEGTS